MKLDTVNDYYPLGQCPKTFDRDYFSKAWTAAGLWDLDADMACTCGVHTYNFSLFRYEDTFYILHRDSGTLITYYKHVGRSNECSREDFNDEDLAKFFKLLAEDLQHMKDNNLEVWWK